MTEIEKAEKIIKKGGNCQKLQMLEVRKYGMSIK